MSELAWLIVWLIVWLGLAWLLALLGGLFVDLMDRAEAEVNGDD